MGDLKHLKYVKRLEDGSFSVIPTKQVETQKDLCSLCGIESVCRIRIARERIKQAGAEVSMSSCKRYVPILTFRKPHVGLNLTFFNTIRAGTTWAFRLNKGSIVCLADAETGEPIRFMRVESVRTGGVDSLLAKHARFNHLAVGGKGAEFTRNFVKKAYGHFLKEDGMLTAIYLRNIKSDFDYQYHDVTDVLYIDGKPAPDNVISISRS
ncbi:hypothetical protein [Klebsiella pneumoniae]|uniref:hypothetical protein n=1 Tax=Klebsiella pneumoniae TaxID=573 RepID=UPI000E2B32D4|nr:hypothetical protein [Klebsiella pneumoniae]SVP40456.1 Uncharacterised protein [Klebsiella pneumoniae]